MSENLLIMVLISGLSPLNKAAVESHLYRMHRRPAPREQPKVNKARSSANKLLQHFIEESTNISQLEAEKKNIVVSGFAL